MADSTRPARANAPREGGSLAGPMFVPVGAHAGKPPIPLQRPVVLIGSRSDARICLQSSSVSKAHALLVYDDGNWYIRDLASREHVFVNGQQLHEADLEDGDLVKIGKFTLKFKSPPAPALSGNGKPPPAKLQVSGHDFPVPIDQRVMLIGRRDKCDIHLLEETASTAHAVIFEKDGRHVIRDLGSRTGTFINGTATRQHRLNPGDVIRIGETDMRFTPDLAARTGVELDEHEAHSLNPLTSEGLVTETLDRHAETAETVETVEDRPIAVEPIEAPQTAAAEISEPAIERLLHDKLPVAEAPSPEQTIESALSDSLRAAPSIKIENLAEAIPATEPPAAEPPAVELPSAEEPLEPVIAEEPAQLPVSAENDAIEAGLSVQVAPSDQDSSQTLPAADQSASDAAVADVAIETPPRRGWRGELSEIEPVLELAIDEAPVAETPVAEAPVPAAPLEVVQEKAEPQPPEPAPKEKESIAIAEIDVVESQQAPSEVEQRDTAGKVLHFEETTSVSELDVELDEPEFSARDEPIEEAAPILLDHGISEAILEPPLAEPIELLEAPMGLPEPEPAVSEIDLSAFHVDEAPAAEAEENLEVSDPVKPLISADALGLAPIKPKKGRRPKKKSPDAPEQVFVERVKRRKTPPNVILDLPAVEEPPQQVVETPINEQKVEVEEIAQPEPVAEAPLEEAPKFEIEQIEHPSTPEPIAEAPIIEAPKFEIEPAAPVVEPLNEAPAFEVERDDSAPAVEPLAEAPAEDVPQFAIEHADAISDSAHVEVLAPTEPTLESALDLPVADADAKLPVEDAEFSEDAVLDALSDSSFGRDVREFAGEESGELIEPPPAAPTPLETAEAPQPAIAEVEAETKPEAEPVAEPQIAKSQAPPPQRDSVLGANQDNFLGGIPLSLDQPLKADPAPREPLAADPLHLVPANEQADVQKPMAAQAPDDEIDFASLPPEPAVDQEIERVSALIDEIIAPPQPTPPEAFKVDAPPIEPLGPEPTIPSMPSFIRPKRPRRRSEDGAWTPADKQQDKSPRQGSEMPRVDDRLDFPSSFKNVKQVDVFSQALPTELDENILSRGFADPPRKPETKIPPVSKAPAQPRPAEPDPGESFWGASPATSEAPVTEDAEKAITELAPLSPRQLDRRARAVRPAMAIAQPDLVMSGPDEAELEAMRLRRKRLSRIPVLLVLMVMLMAGAWVGIWNFIPPRATVEAALSFSNFNSLTEGQKHKFQEEQFQKLTADLTREKASTILRSRDPETPPAYLFDQAAYIKAVGTVAWPVNRSGVMVIRSVSSDPDDEIHRLRAILDAMHNANGGLADDAARRRGDLDTLKAGIEASSKRLEEINREVTRLTPIYENRPSAQQLAALEAEVKRLENAWNDAVGAVKSVEAELQRLQASAPISPAAAAGGKSDVEPAASDTETAELTKQLEELSKKFAAARAAREQEAQAARKVLDGALDQFEKQISAAREMMKDNPELRAYVTAAQTFQDKARQLIADLIRKQQSQVSSLIELRTRLAEKMEQRRLEQFGKDEKLQSMNSELQILQRQYNAALAGGLAQETGDLKAQVDLMQNMIEARRELVPKDSFYAEAISQLEQFIERAKRDMAEDRKHTDETLESLSHGFIANAPAVEKMPEETKQVRAELEKRLADINEARRQYGAVTALSTDDESVKQLQAQMAGVQANIDARKKALADQIAKNASGQQEQGRQDAIKAQQQQLAKANAAEAEARTAYFAKTKELRDSQLLVTASREAGERRDELMLERDRTESQLQTQSAQQELRSKEVASSVRLEDYRDSDVIPIPGRDDRLVYTLASSGAILVAFTLMILMTLRGATRETMMFGQTPRNGSPQDSDTPKLESANGDAENHESEGGSHGSSDDDRTAAIV